MSYNPKLKAVVIGGGTGAPVSIRTLLSLDAEVSAVVAMADDGGSTGVIREEAGSLAPGDIRKCLVAMARDHDDPLTRAFKYRFAFAGDHALGNLMLAALEDATGSFPRAIEICERILEARGHVFPSTLDPVVLTAVTRDGDALTGQAQETLFLAVTFRLLLAQKQVLSCNIALTVGHGFSVRVLKHAFCARSKRNVTARNRVS